MTRNQRIRQAHRWLSMVFTGAVLVNLVLNLMPSADDTIATWVGMATLLPLGLLLMTGLYLFILPYVARNDLSGGTDG